MRFFIVVTLAFLLLAGCAGAPMAVPGSTQVPLVTASSSAQAVELPTEMPVPTQTAVPTATLPPTATPTPEPTPTPTLVPPLELPTEAPNAPSLLYWYGNPTYSGDSLPGYVFRITYSPDLWVPAIDQWGEPVLAHRLIEYCTLAPTIGRGLPSDYTVEHDSRTAGALTFDVTRVSRDGILQFVTYTGGDTRIATAFQVNFVDNSEQCIADAETLLSTLISISAQMTPAAP